MHKRSKHLKSLGSNATSYAFKRPNAKLLERFENPIVGLKAPFRGAVRGSLNIVCPEFTSLCPKTGQPDFATIIIDYTPDLWCVESKSLKLYLMGYRMFGDFHEACVHRIMADLVRLTEPKWLKVTGQFTPRGGIPFWPTSEYERHGGRIAAR